MVKMVNTRGLFEERGSFRDGTPGVTAINSLAMPGGHTDTTAIYNVLVTCTMTAGNWSNYSICFH